MNRVKDIAIGFGVGLIFIFLALLVSMGLIEYVYSVTPPAEYYTLQSTLQIAGIWPYPLLLFMPIVYAIRTKRWFLIIGVLLAPILAITALYIGVETLCGEACRNS